MITVVVFLQYLQSLLFNLFFFLNYYHSNFQVFLKHVVFDVEPFGFVCNCFCMSTTLFQLPSKAWWLEGNPCLPASITAATERWGLTKAAIQPLNGNWQGQQKRKRCKTAQETKTTKLQIVVGNAVTQCAALTARKGFFVTVAHREKREDNMCGHTTEGHTMFWLLYWLQVCVQMKDDKKLTFLN